jgi:hypothetical protein
MDRTIREQGLCRSAAPARRAGRLRIFISYRWSDSWSDAQLLHRDLAARFGSGNVFIDTHGIEYGEALPAVIGRALDDADVVLAVIGPTWLTATGRTGQRRLDDPKDVVRQEIERARANNQRLIPVLLHGTEMPPANDLPETIQWVSDRTAVPFTQNTWRTALASLIERLDKEHPRNRFTTPSEMRRLGGTWGGLAVNALTRPCVLAFGIAIVLIGLVGNERVLILIGAATYLVLSVIAFFTLYEAETVGAEQKRRDATRAAAER